MFAPHACRAGARYRGIRQREWCSQWLRLADAKRTVAGLQASGQREAFAPVRLAVQMGGCALHAPLSWNQGSGAVYRS
jgi:hypothetical protein